MIGQLYIGHIIIGQEKFPQRKPTYHANQDQKYMQVISIKYGITARPEISED